MTKKFDQELHDKYDPVARKLAIKYFSDIGLTCIPNTDKYEIDLVVNNKFYVDVEVKTAWSGHWNDFKYSELNIPDRKEKYLGLDKPSLFMVISKDYSYGFVVEDKILKQCKKELHPNKYNKKEYFFKVPLKKCIKVKFKKGEL